jgi:hypothetical protein
MLFDSRTQNAELLQAESSWILAEVGPLELVSLEVVGIG